MSSVFQRRWPLAALVLAAGSLLALSGELGLAEQPATLPVSDLTAPSPMTPPPMGPQFGPPPVMQFRDELSFQEDYARSFLGNVLATESNILDFREGEPGELAARRSHAERVSAALSEARSLPVQVSLHYRIPKPLREALVNFVLATGCCQAMQVEVDDDQIRIAGSPLVHYSLIRLLTALQTGTQQGT